MVNRNYFSPVEKMSASAIQQMQLSMLRTQIDRLKQNPYFAGRLANVQSEQITDAKAFSELVPVMQKADLIEDQRACPPYGNRLGVKKDEIVYTVTSGGTSGKGREVHTLSNFDAQLVAMSFEWGWHWAGLRPGMKVANTFGVAMTSAGVWMHGALERLEVNHLRLGKYGTGDKCAMILEHRPEVLIATPSYLRTLEAALQADGHTLSELGVHTILTAAEAFSTEFVAEHEELWGAKIYEWYGTSQKFLAFTAEEGSVHSGERAPLHTMANLWFLEVIDPETGMHVEEGEFGEIVATHLNARSSPSLRYATGDRARYLGAGLAGRGFPAIESGTVTRYDDMMKIRALNVWPAQFDAALLGSGVRDYRGEVFIDDQNREQIVINVEFEADQRDPSREQMESLVSAVRDHTGLRARIQLADEKLGEFVDEGSKARRWKDLRDTAQVMAK